jgi:outer membrane protein OmpA-like peptidoglycan-associated protein
MRIIITGFIVLVIWSFLSMWLYVDILKPAAVKPVITEQPVDMNAVRAADSLAKLIASIPDPLIVNYDFDGIEFKPGQQSDNAVTAFKEWLEKYPSSMLLVTGHSDFIGTPEYNKDLGLKRAQNLYEYLLSKGIPAGRIVVTSAGEDEPVAPHYTEEGRLKNRRTEVRIKHN